MSPHIDSVMSHVREQEEGYLYRATPTSPASPSYSAVSAHKQTMSRSRQISLIALLSGIALILRLTVEFPFPLAGYLKLEIWEIPVYVALLAYGLRLSLGTAGIVYLIVQVFASGPLPTGPIFNFVAVLSTVVGAFPVLYLLRKHGDPTRSWRIAAAVTASGALVRVGIMTIYNQIMLPLPFPLGFSMPVQALPPTLIIIAIFNLTVATYSLAASIPIAARISQTKPEQRTAAQPFQ